MERGERSSTQAYRETSRVARLVPSGINSSRSLDGPPKRVPAGIGEGQGGDRGPEEDEDGARRCAEEMKGDPKDGDRFCRGEADQVAGSDALERFWRPRGGPPARQDRREEVLSGA